MSTLHTTSRVRLRSLIIRPEDGEYVVGSLDNGEFVAVPEVGRRAIELLGRDWTLSQAGQKLGQEFGGDVDLTGFVAQLCDLGFVRSIDDRPVDGGAPGFRPNLPRLRPAHVRWLFGRWFRVLYVAVLAAAAVVVAGRSGPGWLRYDTLLWLDSISLALAANLGLIALLAALHELAHLVAARSLGLPARIGISTRLGALTPVTDVRCLWAVPPRQRYRVYLAGMASDLLVISVAQLLGSYAGPLRAPMDALSLLAVLTLLGQLQLYTRTDLYLVATTLSRAGNLHQDALAHLLDRLRRARHRLTRRPIPPRPDPLCSLPAREARIVRRYAVVMVAGSAVAIALTVAVVVANLVTAVLRAVATVRGAGWLGALDGLATLTILVAVQALFVVTLLRLRGERLRRLHDRLR
jgi:putative peptide zinc metalloprotease protein